MASMKWDKLVVWLAETDGNYSNSLRSALKDRRSKVFEFSDGAVVEEQLKQGKEPHLIVANAEMDNGSALKLCKKVRERTLGSNPFLPIFLSTWDESDENIHNLRNAGASLILGKPFSQSDGIKWIEDFSRKDITFIATGDYIGPERRSPIAALRPSRARQVRVPNIVGMVSQGKRIPKDIIEACWRKLQHERVHSTAWSILSAFHLAIQFPSDEEGQAEITAAKIALMCREAVDRMDGLELKTCKHAFAAAGAFAQSVADFGWEGDEADRQMAMTLSQALGRAVLNDRSEAEIAEQIHSEVTTWLGHRD